jgi:hypothetical protein
MGIQQISLNNSLALSMFLETNPKHGLDEGGKLCLSSFMLPEFTFLYIAFISWWIA